MAWIESHQELRHHPKLSAVCRILSAERSHVVGHLHFLWWWCMDYALDGDLAKYTDQQISDASEWKGNAAEYVSALVKAGFLDINESGVRIHDWLDFCGELVLKRLDRRKEKRAKSEGNARRTADIVRRNPPVSAENPPTVPNQTQPNQTVPNQTKDKGMLFEIPEDLKESESEITDWLEYKRQRGQTYKSKGLDALWRTIRKIPKGQRREAVDHSMSNNWSGLFEKKNGGSNGQQRAYQSGAARDMEPERTDSKYSGIVKTIRV